MKPKKDRRPLDNYATPIWCIEKLLDEYIPPSAGLLIDPAAGTGNILSVLHRRGIDMTRLVGTDIIDGYDFLSEDWAITDYDCHLLKPAAIISNPPYSLAFEFVKKSLTLCDEVVMLLRLGFLASQTRYGFWQQHPCQRIIVLSERPSFDGDGTDNSDYGWFIWAKRPSLVPFSWVVSEKKERR